MEKLSVKSVSSTKQVVFIENKIPSWESKTYSISINQHIENTNTNKSFKDNFAANESIIIRGERFSLSPETIDSYFPPANSQGAYSNCLPHIVFKTTTLPWQRDNGSSQKFPWLALLTFYSSENPMLINTSVDKVITDNLPSLAAKMIFSDLQLKAGESGEQKCSVIDVSVNLFNELAPSLNDLYFLAHVRKVNIMDKSILLSKLFGAYDRNQELSPTQEYSVAISNRLLPNNGKVYVYLVSLEGLGNYLPKDDGTSNIPDGKECIRLISLANWSFEVLPSLGSLSEKIANLNKNPTPYTSKITLELPDLPNSNDDSSQKANLAIQMGYCPLNHHMRGGDNIISWYRGPFAPYPVDYNLAYPNSNSDSLLRYDPDIGMFDVSYSAAWELGKLLALKDQGFAKNLYLWKKQNIQNTIKILETEILSSKFNIDQPKSAKILPLTHSSLSNPIKKTMQKYIESVRNG